MSADTREAFVRWTKLFGLLIKPYRTGSALFDIGRIIGLLDCFNAGLKYLTGHRIFIMYCFFV